MLESILEYLIPIPLDSLFDMTPKEALVMSLFASALGVGLGLMAAGVAGYVALLIWVARDAMARGMDASILWMLMVLFTGPVGLLVYVVARPEGELVRCATCRNRRLEARLRCPHCDGPRSVEALGLEGGPQAGFAALVDMREEIAA